MRRVKNRMNDTVWLERYAFVPVMCEDKLIWMKKYWTEHIILNDNLISTGRKSIVPVKPNSNPPGASAQFERANGV